MAILDKRGSLTRLQDASLELGCGGRKRHPEALGIDALDHECVDIVGRCLRCPGRKCQRPLSRPSIPIIFLSMSADLPRLMDLLARVMQPAGLLRVVVPHFSNPYFYSDYSHRGFFGLYSFSYLVSDNIHRRKVPTYGREICFELSQAELIFKSSPPFYVRHGFKKILQMVFNLNRWTRELYEENFCYLLPCYEIRFEMRRSSPSARPRPS